MGHEVIITAPDENILLEKVISYEEGMTVLRIKTGRIKSASRLVRAINEMRLSQTMWKRGGQFFKENPADLIVYYSPTIFFGSLVERLKKVSGCRCRRVARRRHYS